MTSAETIITQDTANRKLIVTRSFTAPLKSVWAAWTQSDKLDKWWAPKPYRARTKSMDFREGGKWIYCMVGSEGDGMWCREDYRKIELHKNITNGNAFCDEEGELNNEFPAMEWSKQFQESGNVTTVVAEILFDSVADME